MRGSFLKEMGKVQMAKEALTNGNIRRKMG